MTSNTTNENLRFEYLDGIRGVAAIIVVINHFRNAFYDSQSSSVIYSFVWDRFKYFFLTGHFCVELFFVLSGFVLAFNSFNKSSFLEKQWLKRIYRLVVPIFITSFIYFIFSNYNLFYFKELSKLYFTDWVSQHWLIHYTFSQFTIRCFYDFLLFSDWQFVMNVNSSLWTIPVELYWSYILFVLFFILSKLKNVLIKNLFILLYAIIISSLFYFKGIEFGILFFGGTIIALNYEFIVSKWKTQIINFISIIITLIFTYLVELNILTKIELNFISWHNFMAFFYIILAVRINFIQFFFSLSVIKWLGRISFSLYLLHILIIGSFSSKLYLVFPYFRSDFGLIVLLMVTLCISTLIAHLYTIYIDEKLMKFYDFVYQYILCLVKPTSKKYE